MGLFWVVLGNFGAKCFTFVSTSEMAWINVDNGKCAPENGYGNDKLIHRLYGAVTIDGETYRVKTTVVESRISNDKIFPHSLEVTNVELLSNDSSSTVEPTASGYQGRLTYRITKLLNGVEKSYDQGGFWMQAKNRSITAIMTATMAWWPGGEGSNPFTPTTQENP